jgi:hypothetical protein
MFMLWACKTLPAESWQILAAIPIAKDAAGQWRGMNLTYYGLLTANAAVAATALLFVLMTGLGVPVYGTIAIVAAELALCVPAAKLVARLVEKKACTFTIAGACFVGLVTAPWAITLVNWTAGERLGLPIPVTATMAAILTAYAFGEGLGRLACISFGCCYGKPLSQLPLALQRVFERWHFVFFGKMKKIAYASGLEGERVLPIQAITSGLYLCTGLVATLLFLRGRYVTVLLLTVVVTQGWRVMSEILRADYRGEGKMSVYQVMGLLSIPYTIWLPNLFPSMPFLTPNITVGLQAIWSPGVVLFLQGLWAILFVVFGKSMVTGAAISFHLHEDRI